MKYYAFIPVVLSFFLFGCSFKPAISTTTDVYLNTKIENDAYKKDTWIKSPRYSGNHGGNGYYRCFWRAYAVNNNIQFYQLYVFDDYPDWRFYNHAYDLKGNQLDFSQISQDVSSDAWCGESFGISFTESEIHALKGNPFQFKAFGQKGDRTFFVPAIYLEGFLQKVDEYKKQ